MVNEVQEMNKKNNRQKSKQGSATPVGPVGRVLISTYLILLTIFLLYGLVSSWPTTSTNSEVLQLLIVAMAGALGSLVHALRSLSWYIGNRKLVHSWLPSYILLPFVGATLSLAFYLVIRGGFFSPEATVEQTQPFGFAALAVLIGMFSDQAIERLKKVAETLLAEVPEGADPVTTKEKKADRA